MPIFIIFISLLLAAITGIVLTSVSSLPLVLTQKTEIIVRAIIVTGIGVSTLIILKPTICNFCSFFKLNKLNLCACNA